MEKQELKARYENWKEKAETMTEIEADFALQELTAEAERAGLGDYLDQLALTDILNF